MHQVNRQQAWDSFLTRWPLVSLQQLTLQQYADNYSKDSFCYWVEHGTRDLGSLNNYGYSNYGIYNNNAAKPEDRDVKHGEQYSWKVKFGEHEHIAFQAIKAILIDIATAARAGDFAAVEKIDFSPLIKWKLAFLYQDQNNIQVFPIYAKAWLNSLTGSQKNGSYVEAYQKLLAAKQGKDFFSFVEELVQSYRSPKASELSLSGRVQAFLERWPADKIAELELADYYSTADAGCFIRQLTRLNAWNDESYPNYYLLWEPKGDVTDKQIEHIKYTYGKPYSWEKAYGSTAEEVLVTIKQLLLAVVDAVNQTDLEQIELINLPDHIKWAAAFVYQDLEQPVVLPIFTKIDVKRVGYPGFDKKPLSQVYPAILRDRQAQDYYDFVEQLWRKIRANKDMNEVEPGVADNDQQTLLRHFQGHKDFRERQPLWGSTTTELFIRLARAVNSMGLDWWFVLSTNSQLRFGRKEKGEGKGGPVGWLFLRKDGIRFTWDTFAGLAGGESNDLTEALVQRFESANKDEGSWPDKLGVRAGRNGYWPDNYSLDDNTVENERSSSMEDKPNQNSSSRLPRNFIYYGPAGTGKTYHSINKALEIIDPAFLKANSQPEQRGNLKQRFDELVNEQRIRFVTFHQSFSYEDFVEGISASVEQQEGQAAEAKLGFEIKPGIFKQICDAARTKTITYHSSDNIDLQGKRIWKMSLGVAGYEDDVFDYCMQHDIALLGWGEELDFSSCNSRQEISQFMQDNNMVDYLQQYPSSPRFVDVFKHDVKIGDIIIVSDGNTKFRAIGIVTGEYALHHDTENPPRYVQKRPVKWLKSYEPSLSYDLLFKKRLTQISLYELGDGTIKREQLAELLKPQAKEELENSKPYVLIIDEINRGNISRIFGELITLIEDSKREGAAEALSVVLPYSKTPFSVPDNVYIIGTMNSSDRSLTGLDIALRRRFSFEEMQPDLKPLEGVYVEGVAEGKVIKVDIKSLLEVINQRIEILLDRDHCIGHAYFIPLRHNPSLTLLASIFQYRIMPLLQEYFFDDWQRIDWVLGQNGMLEKQYKGEDALRALFPKTPLSSIQNNAWKIKPDSFDNIQCYYDCYAIATE